VAVDAAIGHAVPAEVARERYSGVRRPSWEVGHGVVGDRERARSARERDGNAAPARIPGEGDIALAVAVEIPLEMTHARGRSPRREFADVATGDAPLAAARGERYGKARPTGHSRERDVGAAVAVEVAG